MHRTSPWAWSLCLGALVALSAVGPVPTARGQLCSPESRQIVLPINSTFRLQMLNKKRIKAVTNPKEGVLTIRTVDTDPSSVILLGTGAGITRLELEDHEGCKEVREILVQADVEYLTGQLKKAVPLGNINVIPNGANAVVLSGYVQRAEDVSVAQAVAQSVGFTVINGLRLNGVQQVQLDVVIAQVRRTKGRNFGFNFLQNSRRQILGSSVGNLLPQLSQSLVGVPGVSLQPTDFGQIINTAPGSANLFGGVIGNNTGFLGFLQDLESEGLAKILSQPRLVTLSGNPASFLAGGEQAIPVPAGLGQVGVQFEEFGTRLNFLPIVLGNGRVHLEVEPEVSTLDPNAGVAIAGATVAGRATQRIHTTVELETGQTFVIGGLIQKVHTGSTDKVPLLGQLPFIGAAFSVKSFTEDETELVVMVTPHLVDAQSADQVVKVLPGQETRTPDDFELFLEGILEAPRGPRAVFINGRYVPAHRNGPTSDLFPCAGSNDGCCPRPLISGGIGGGIGGHGCDKGSCGTTGGGVATTPAVKNEAVQPVENRVPATPTPTPAPLSPAVHQEEPKPTTTTLPPIPPTEGMTPVKAEPPGGSLTASTPEGDAPPARPAESNPQSDLVPPIPTGGDKN